MFFANYFEDFTNWIEIISVWQIVTAHQDGTFLYTEPSSAIGFWIPLENATTQNGCLQFIKGSHKTGIHRRFLRNPDNNSKELIIFDRPCPSYPLSNFTNVPVNRGKIEFH